MRHLHSTRYPSVRLGKRRGTAQIELALFLPTYAAMIMIMFTVFSFTRTRGQTAVDARHEAWMKRDKTGSQTEVLSVSAADTEQLGRILNNEQDPSLGLVTASSQKNARIYLKTLDLLTDIRLDHAVLTDPWDYRTIPFEEQQQHPRLQADKRISVFGTVNRGAFASLASVTAGFSAEASVIQQNVRQSRARASRRVSRAKETVAQKISETEMSLDRLNDDLRNELRLVPPNEQEIAELRSRIDKATQVISTLKQQLSKLDEAEKHLREQLDSSPDLGE